MSLPAVAVRFLRYVQVDTQSDPDSDATPSTEQQKNLARILVGELRQMGIMNAHMDEYGYVYASLPSNLPAEEAVRTPAVALLAHMDTSPDEAGADVRPVVHSNYDGGVLVLPGNADVHLDPAHQPELLSHIGHDLITSDGTTLLGSDDKAGVAILLQLAADLLQDPEWPRPELHFCFTVDEEIGRGVDKLELEKLHADVAYTLDGSGVDTLFVETFHAAEASVAVKGRMVHPGYAKGVMVNALRILAECIAALPHAESPEHTDSADGYFHPHQLSGGEAGEAVLKLLLRDFSEEGLLRRKNFVLRTVEALQLKFPEASISLTMKDQYRNMKSYIEEVDPRAISFAVEAGREMGITLQLCAVRGGTDGARLSEMGLPTPNIFTGGHAFHSRFEWNSVQNLVRSLEYTKRLVQYWAIHGREDNRI